MRRRWWGLGWAMPGSGSLRLMICRMRFSVPLVLALGVLPGAARGAERLTLKNGFEVECDRREMVGDHLRIYLRANAGPGAAGGGGSFMDVAADAVVRSEAMPDAAESTFAAVGRPGADPKLGGVAVRFVGAAEMRELAAEAGKLRNIDRELLLSVIHAESGGRALAISRTGARGLMQLMPGTAAAMGVADALRPRDNVVGGTAYLDQMLRRYHDNLALALAAYNAGPGAVDRWHGVPPYHETRAYVARVIGEFNRRKGAEEALAHGR